MNKKWMEHAHAITSEKHFACCFFSRIKMAKNNLNYPNFNLNAEGFEETNRYPDLSEQELQEILENKHSEKTRKTTNWSVSTFKCKIQLQKSLYKTA